QLTAQGTKVFYAIVTNGYFFLAISYVRPIIRDKGCGNTACYNLTSPQIAAMRQQEQYNAGQVLNVPESNIILMDYEDAQVTS
ncbi:PIG-L family deacetylase, partial [Vibrio cholerae]|uniref:PIG-L family deacetylase n=1 Tax=Vibrio cholerae TaxID=666 RepID=UPI0018F09F66